LKSREEIRTKLINEYPKKPLKDIELILDMIERALNPIYAHLLTICRPRNGNAEIDMAVLQALLKAEKENTEQKKDTANNIELAKAQLGLALEWNRIDIVKKYILTPELKEQVGLNISYFIFSF
jgi:hypothetical protein